MNSRAGAAGRVVTIGGVINGATVGSSGFVAYGEQRRRREAMEQLVVEICKAEDSNRDADDISPESYGGAEVENGTPRETLSGGVRNSICNHLRTAIERGYLNDFGGILAEARTKKEKEIDRICSRHYADFLTSSREMLKMKGSAQVITEKVKEMITNFNSTGGNLTKVLNELQNIQTEKENCRNLLDSCTSCKDVAALMVQTRQQIESDDHYSAMRTIEIIKGEVKMLKVQAMVDFVNRWLPVAVNKLLYGAKQEAETFLQQRRNNLETIGLTVLRKQAELSTASDPLYLSSSLQRPLDSAPSSPTHNTATPRTRSSMDLFSPFPPRNSISLKNIRLNSRVFNLERWSSPNEFDNLVPAHFKASAQTSNEGLDMLESLLHDTGPLHKVLHLYAVLGNLNSYHDSYRNGRDMTLRNIMQQADRAANANSQQGLSMVLPRYIDSLIGFFTVECAHRRSVEIADGAFSMTELAALWEKSCLHMAQLCSTFSITASCPEELIIVKEEMLLLIDTIADDAFGLKVNLINDIMKDLWEVFQGLQVDSIVRSCSTALETSAYQPYFVSSDEIFKQHIRAYRLDSIELNMEQKKQKYEPGSSKMLDSKRNNIFSNDAAANLDLLEEEMDASLSYSVTSSSRPVSNRGGISLLTASSAYNTQDSFDADGSFLGGAKKGRQSLSSHIFMAQTFPFSEAVPQLMHELYLFVVRFFVFAVKNPHLGSRSEEICSAIVGAYQAIGKLLTKELHRDGSDTPLSKACQISIDAATLAAAADSLWLMVEAALMQFRWTEKIDAVIAAAMEKVSACMRLLVTQAQDLIFELLSIKISDLLGSLVFVNFEPDVVPHESIESLIDFLQITFMWLTHLPMAVREAVHFTCCSKIATGILEHLLSPRKVPSLNVLCIAAFDVDLRKLLQFADGCSVPNLKQCFDEMHALIKSILHPDLPQLADNIALRRQLFPHLNIEKLAKTLTRGLAKKFKAQLKKA
eukprot:gene20501-26595_t